MLIFWASWIKKGAAIPQCKLVHQRWQIWGGWKIDGC